LKMRFKLRTISVCLATLCLITAIVLCAVVANAGEVSSIKVYGKTIRIYDTADHVFAVLKESDMVSQTIQKDPNNANSLLLVKNYKVKSMRFTLYFARVEDPGPYKVIRIISY